MDRPIKFEILEVIPDKAEEKIESLNEPIVKEKKKRTRKAK